ncbi:hypothetical protein GJ496_010425 [Pomphorhynchus laevis]|nr:hypothetical protein GJ496_010425 [Pomphorhynchus laevis]
MPKYYCDYCDTYLTHDSPSVRRTHNQGRNHKENVRLYYQQWMEEQAQKLIDQTTAAFKSGKFSSPAAQAVAMAAMHGAQSTLNFRVGQMVGGPTLMMHPGGMIPRGPPPQGAYFYPTLGNPAVQRFTRPGSPYPMIRLPPNPAMIPRVPPMMLPHHQLPGQLQPHHAQQPNQLLQQR